MNETAHPNLKEKPTEMMGDTLATIEKGEKVSFSVGFDKERLAALTPEDLIDEDTYEYEDKIDRARNVLEVYGRLPERLDFQPGMTAIFGENGAGKTLLADVIIMAIAMEQHRQKHGLSRKDDLFTGDTPFYPSLPGNLTSSPHGNQDDAKNHARFVARIAETMMVEKAVLLDTERTVGVALRSPSALGNVAMGMSSRQAIDMLDAMSRSRRANPSVKIYDEPELGMSPRRHLQLVEELSMRSQDGSVELIPSNSPVLFQAEVPRIDLDRPERGVFTPEAA